MKERSGMPYDVVAFENDELAISMTPEEEGIFHRILRKAWVNGSAPSDLDQLAYLCRINPRTMRKVWVKLSRMFTEMDGNSSRIISKKLESERKYLEEKRNLSRIAGKASAKARQIKETESTDVEHMGSTSHPSPPLPIPTQQEKGEEPLAISSPVVPKYTSAFENFWEASTRRGSKLKAFGVWKRLGTFPQGELLAIYAAMVNWKNSEQWQDETKQPHISTWLGRRGWEEIVPKRAIAENLRGGLIERQSLEHTTHFCGNCEVNHDWPCGELCTTGPGPRSCPEFVGRYTRV